MGTLFVLIWFSFLPFIPQVKCIMAKYNTGLNTNSQNGNIQHEYPCGRRIPFVNMLHIQVDYNHVFMLKLLCIILVMGMFFLHIITNMKRILHKYGMLKFIIGTHSSK